MAQVARQPLQDGPWLGGQQVVGLQFQLRPILARQQLPAVVGVQAPAAARVQQVIGSRYPQQEVPREVHADHGDIQAPCHLQCDQAHGQGLPAFALQHFVQQRGGGAQRRVVILGKPQVIHAPQQRLAEFIRR